MTEFNVVTTVTKVVGTVIKAGELLGRGPVGIQQKGNTCVVVWNIEAPLSYVLHFAFDDETGKVTITDWVSPKISQSARAYLKEKGAAIMDYVVINEQTGALT